jgi:K+-transporting ATPase ATPase C chain
MASLLRPAVTLFVFFSIAAGVVYPALVTGIANLAFPVQARGSLVERDGQAVGSELIGQSFSTARYFWSRPSATTPMPNNGQSSGGSNLGPLNPALIDAVKGRIEALGVGSTSATTPVPIDLVTTSASGLDPDISPEAALFQIERIAHERGLPIEKVKALVTSHTRGPQWGIFGEPRVNVLDLNLALDALASKP